MTDEQILKAAIEKAKTNGYEWYGDLYRHWQVIIAGVGFWDENVDTYAKSNPFSRREQCSIQEIIFSFAFAKAFFGEELCCFACGDTPKTASGHCYYCDNNDDPYYTPSWQYYLQEMVIHEVDGKQAPLQYLKQFLDLEGEK